MSQNNYCITEIFNPSFSFLNNNIEIKDGCKFDKICEIRLLIKEDVGWYGRANFGGKSFDSVHLIPL